MNHVDEVIFNNIEQNINIKNFMDNYPVTRTKIVGNSLLLQGTSDHEWIYIASQSEVELTQLVDSYVKDEDKYFAVIQDWMIPIIKRDKEIEWILSCDKYIQTKEINIDNGNHDIRQLTENDADYIYNNYDYSDYASVSYIKQRINQDFSYGIFCDDTLVAWIMTHDDGAIGLLHVIPEYRGRGYASTLVSKISKELNQHNRLRFMHIEEENYKSVNMALKCGYSKIGKISWFKIK